MIRPIALLLCVLLAASGAKADSEQSKSKSSPDSDARLLHDIERAGAEFERRMMTGLTVQDGLVWVRDPNSGSVSLITYLLPANSPWTISCGFGGIEIILGNSVTGDSSGAGNDVRMLLTATNIGLENCKTLSFRIGKRLKAALDEANTR